MPKRQAGSQNGKSPSMIALGFFLLGLMLGFSISRLTSEVTSSQLRSANIVRWNPSDNLNAKKEYTRLNSILSETTTELKALREILGRQTASASASFVASSSSAGVAAIYQEETVDKADKGSVTGVTSVSAASAANVGSLATIQNLPNENQENIVTCTPDEIVCYTDLPHSLRTPPDEKYLHVTKKVLQESFCSRFGGRKSFPPSLCKEALPEVKPVCTDQALATAYCSTLQKGLVAKSSRDENNAARDICKSKSYSPCKPYSQQYEDMVLFSEYFVDSVGSSYTYLELGALDGVRFANTKFYDETLGWHGVLIEASASSFSRLRNNRSPSTNAMYNLAVCAKKGMVELLGTNAEAGVAETMSQLHFKRNKRYGKKQVRCDTMKSILIDANVASIDLWSLDVEGAEYDVLVGMDWEIPVHVIIIERNPRDREIETLLLKKGYRYSREQRGNRIWVDDHYKEKRMALAGDTGLKTGVREVDQYGSVMPLARNS